MNQQGLLQLTRKMLSQQGIDSSNLNAAYQQIIEHCKKHYVSILPNNLNRWMDTERGQPTLPSTKQRPENGMDRDDQSAGDIDRTHIQQLIRQQSIVIQLMLQVCMLSNDQDLRIRCYEMLDSVRSLMCKDVQQMQEILSNRTGKPIVKQKVNLTEMLEDKKREPIVVDLPPQISIYQDPLLYLIFNRTAHKCLFQPTSNRSKSLQILQSYSPFVNKLWIPIQESTNGKPTKAKFSQLDDRLLLLGLIRHTNKNIDKIRQIYLPDRGEEQLKNRIKNLCAKSSSSLIKAYRHSEFEPMTDQEIRRFAEGLLRYGQRFEVISRYMQLRTAKFLEEQYNDLDRLRKKREREGVKSQSIREKLERYQNELASQMQIEKEGDYPFDIQSESHFLALRDLSEPDLNGQYQSESKFKLIQNVTFEYEEI